MMHNLNKIVCFFVLGISTLTLKAEVETKVYTFIGGTKAGKSEYSQHKKLVRGLFKESKLEDNSFMGKYITLSNSVISYSFWLHGNKDKSGKWNASLGMCGPSKANWYYNDFYNLSMGGVKNQDAPVILEEVKSADNKAYFVVKWQFPSNVAKLKITLADGDKHVSLETTVSSSPESEVKSYSIKLLCYPSAFAGGFKDGNGIRKRVIVTPTRTIKAWSTKPSKIILADTEPWVLFYDDHFDRKNNLGEGPCALLFNPHDSKANYLLYSNYSCYLKVKYPIRTISNFLLWDFHDSTNAVAEQFMRELNVKFKDN